MGDLGGEEGRDRGALEQRARRGEGPTLIEVKTDRFFGHFQGDAEAYRPKGEVEELHRHDPIPALGAVMKQRGVADDAALERMRGDAKRQVDAAFEFARSSAYPEPAAALQHVFA